MGVPVQALHLAVGEAGHHPDGHGHPETTNFKHPYHPKQHLILPLWPIITSWGVLDLALLLAVGVAGHQFDGHCHPETTNSKHQYHPKQHLILPLCHKITSFGCPSSSSSPGCWRGWAPSRWSWLSGNTFQSLILLAPTSLSKCTWLRNQSPRDKSANLVPFIV